MKYYVPLAFILAAAVKGIDVVGTDSCDANPESASCVDNNEGSATASQNSSTPVLFDVDYHPSCPTWAAIPNRCLLERIEMLDLCPDSCRKIANVSAQTLTDEQVMEDAVRGYAIVYTEEDENMVEEECVDDDEEECEKLVEEGKCMTDYDGMAKRCPKGCHICFAQGTTVVDFGVEQDTDYHRHKATNDEIVEVIEETLEYVVEEVIEDSQFEHLRRDCYNTDPKCSYYAAKGLCDTDVKWMQENCAPACQSCMAKEYWHICGATPDMKNALKNGGVVNLFERILESYPADKVTVHSYPETRKHVIEEKKLRVVQEPAVDWSAKYSTFEEWLRNESDFSDADRAVLLETEKPWVLTLEDFLTDEECDFFIEQGYGRGFERSAKVMPLDDAAMTSGDDGVYDDERTSRNTWCDQKCAEHPIGKRVIEKMSSLTGLPVGNSEDLQLLKYEVGEHYTEHHDSNDHWADIAAGHRILTVFLYLNDVEEGGETRLTTLNLDVKPKRGKALIWPSVLNDNINEIDPWAWHQALPVKKGQKFGANAWYHLRNYQDFDDNDYGCM